MKAPRSLTLTVIGLGGWLWMAAIVQAGPVQWATVDINAEDDIFNTGTFLGAVNYGRGADGTGGDNSAEAVTVNGVNFAAGTDTGNLTGATWTNGTGDFSTQYLGGLNTLMSGLVWAPSNTQTFTLSGLTAGRQYRLQWLTEVKGQTRGTDLYLQGEKTTFYVTPAGKAQNVSAYFTASGAQAVISQVANTNGATINAYALHDVTDVPPPSTPLYSQKTLAVETDIVNTGDWVKAVNIDSNGTESPTVNGIVFRGVNDKGPDSASGLSSGWNYTGTSLSLLPAGSLRTLMDNIAYVNSGSQTLQLTGLVPGQRYRLQLLSEVSNQTSLHQVSIDGVSHVLNLRDAPGSTRLAKNLTAEFTAKANSATVTYSTISAVAPLNGYVVQALSPRSVLIDDDFDNGYLATNTTGVGGGFFFTNQSGNANVTETGGSASFQSTGWSVGSLASDDAFTLNSTGHRITFDFANLIVGRDRLGVVGAAFAPGNSFFHGGTGGAPLLSFNTDGSSIGGSEIPLSGVAGGNTTMVLDITDTTYALRQGGRLLASGAHGLGAGAVRVANSYQNSGGGTVATLIDRITAVNIAPVITPVGATATSNRPGGTDEFTALRLIDGSGLTGSGDTATHGTSPNNAMWLTVEGLSASQRAAVEVVFDLGRPYDLTEALVWQFNQTCCLDSGVQSMDILVSSDGASYSNLGSFDLTRGTGGGAEERQALLLNTRNVEWVKFTNFVTYNNTVRNDIGLSEVRFTGTPTIPEPGSVVLLVLGGCLLLPSLVRRRKR